MAIDFRPSDELARRLREQADAEHVSVQDLLVKVAEHYLSRNTKNLDERANVPGLNGPPR